MLQHHQHHISQQLLQLYYCPICKQIPQKPLNLRCQHHPCLDCINANKYIKILSTTTTTTTNTNTTILNNNNNHSYQQLQTKYQIKCPFWGCKRTTITYDIQNLVININMKEKDIIKDVKDVKDVKDDKKEDNGLCQDQVNKEGKQEDDQQENCCFFIDLVVDQEKKRRKQKQKQQLQRSINNQIIKNDDNENGDNENDDDSQKELFLVLKQQQTNFTPPTTLATKTQQPQPQAQNSQQQNHVYTSKTILKNLTYMLMQQKQQSIKFYTNLQKKLNSDYKAVLDCLNHQYNYVKNILKQRFCQVVCSYNKGVELLKQAKRMLEMVEIQYRQLKEKYQCGYGYGYGIEESNKYNNQYNTTSNLTNNLNNNKIDKNSVQKIHSLNESFENIIKKLKSQLLVYHKEGFNLSSPPPSSITKNHFYQKQNQSNWSIQCIKLIQQSMKMIKNNIQNNKNSNNNDNDNKNNYVDGDDYVAFNNGIKTVNVLNKNNNNKQNVIQVTPRTITTTPRTTITTVKLDLQKYLAF